MSANDLAAKLERSQNTYITMMSDGHNSIIVRSKDDELTECYRLMRAAAALLREQAEQLDTLRNAMSTCSGSCHAALAAAGGGVPEEGATDE